MPLDRLELLVGEEFQTFCEVLFTVTVPGFQAVDGSGGDGGNDGFIVAGDTVFQIYGPKKPDSARTKKKIVDSLDKAATLRETVLPALSTLCFVTPSNLTPDLTYFLLDQASARGLAAEAWGQAKLLGLLAMAPEPRTLFGAFLVPDVFAELRALRAEVASIGTGTALPADAYDNAFEEIAGPDYHPDIFVLKNNEPPGSATRRADEQFRMRVYAPVLRHEPFEPSEEQAFLAQVQTTFWEDPGAVLEEPSNTAVCVENRDHALVSNDIGK